MGLADKTFGNVPYRDLYLVRVQSGMDNDFADRDGLVLNRGGSTRWDDMNTVHFAINAVVGNHAMGKQFDSAKFVIIAPLLDTVAAGNTPDGFLPSDTYFQADKNGDMRVPNARLVAPEGAKVPAGMEDRTHRYKEGATPDETMRSRNQAVEQVFKNNNAPLFNVDFHGWSGAGGPKPDIRQLAQDMTSGREYSLGLASTGLAEDWSMQSGATRGALKDYLNGERLRQTSTGMDIPIYEFLQGGQKGMRTFIDQRVANNADPKAVQFYERQYSQISKELLAARPVRAAELREQRAADREYRSKHASTVPPPLPQTPPPLPSSDGTVALKGTFGNAAGGAGNPIARVAPRDTTTQSKRAFALGQ